MTESTSSAPPAPASSLFSEFRTEVTKLLDTGISILETEQSKINAAFFEALSMEQRDTFCQSLSGRGVKPQRIQKITKKSQPTVNRHLNGKNS